MGLQSQQRPAEFCPCSPNGDTLTYLDSIARVYRSDIPQDTARWPERDSLGRMIVASDQELWATCTDAKDIYMVAPDRPIGIQVTRRSYAWNSPGPWGDIVKMEFVVKNVTGRWLGNPHVLRHMIVGLSVDADIGNESGYNSNDLCFFDRTQGNPYPNLVVQYQLDQEPGWSIPPPYFVAFRCFVETPKATDTVMVRDSLFPRTILPGESLGTTAIKWYTNQSDPQTAFERYLYLKGMLSLSDTNHAYGGKSEIGNKRFLASCGPFSLPNDSRAQFSVNIIYGLDSADIVHKAGLLAVEAHPKVPSPRVAKIELYPVSPNPVTGSALIRYTLQAPSQVSVKVYDISGRLVRVLEEGNQSSGSHSILWDRKDESRRFLPSGVYFVRIDAGNYRAIKQTVVVK